MTSVDTIFRNAEKRLAVLEADTARLSAELDDARKELELARATKLVARQAGLLVQKAGEAGRMQVRDAFADSFTTALRMVFGEDYNVNLEVKMFRDRPACSMSVSTPTDVGGDPMDTRGGGVVDAIALSARLATLAASRGDGAAFCIMDEPTKQLNSSRVPEVASMMKAMCNRYGLQIIFVTHQRDFLEHIEGSTEL